MREATEFGQHLKELRERKCSLLPRFRGVRPMSQAELARKINVHPSMISQMECGKRHPSVVLAKQLAEVLEVSLDDLLDKIPRQ